MQCTGILVCLKIIKGSPNAKLLPAFCALSDAKGTEINMKKYPLCLWTAILLICSVHGTAFAASINSLHVTMNPSSNLVTVTGSIYSGTNPVTGNVYNSEDNEVTLFISDPDGNMEYVNQTTSGSGGTFNFTYTMMQPKAGTYNVFVGGEGITARESGTFTYTPSAADAPKFTIQYYSDEALTLPLSNSPHVKAGTYYLKVTSDVQLSAPPTVTIDAEGSANDITNAAAVAVGGNTYRITRTIASIAEAIGVSQETIMISGSSTSGGTAVNAAPQNAAQAAIYTDTTPPTAIVDAAVLASGTLVGGAKSSELGTIYLLPEASYLSEANMLAVDGESRSQAAVTSINTVTAIQAPAANGVYRMYAVDLAGNISAASPNTVTVSKQFELDVDWKVGAAEHATSLIGGKTVIAAMTAKNKQGIGQETTLILALLNEEDVIVNMAYVTIIIPANQTFEFKAGFRLPGSITGYKSRAYALEGNDWTSTSAMPLGAASELNEEP
jgi:hypothetical protein